MNSSDVCHIVKDVPGLYVDAFRGRLLRKTQDPTACFILTHYHGDHYQSLPREGKYAGPAIIHCSPVTAALLEEMHQVQPDLVKSHKYGEPFQYRVKSKGGDKVLASITFYDANHCPGACIVLIELPNGHCHVHTGDMRYHDKFKSYPLLKHLAAKKKVDLVYLDTTYSHPKHDFVPQEEAVEAIASQTAELLSSSSKTLVMLSCYSIGKEKVLWEASNRANQMLYVNERKMKMLKCVQLHDSQDAYQIINRCTEDVNKSDIHVIPMGLAGEMWPYFRPNFVKCKEYVEKLDKEYEKVVAFLPTGWADASNWNKKNSVSKKDLDLENGKRLQVEIRLISYSEHSAFRELIDFVQFLRPQKVIPTVFSDEADCRRIQDRFRHLIDSTRAKQAFFKSMNSKLETKLKESSKHLTKANVIMKVEADAQSAPSQICIEEDDIEIVCVKPSTANQQMQQIDPNCDNSKVKDLVDMGFDYGRAKRILDWNGGNLNAAINALLAGEGEMAQSTPSPPAKKQRKSPQITSFFSKKTT
ncbi:unnamed protein product [Cylindrotheca closterium]|uniref:UBA domain-containing protein n=1 Tax=Cylindrotheca closterium TaxID=2856 RepID=A0AAD2G062_9STRA|nr:unnamed protein product [Cylindrotheca closterium]